MVLDSDMKQPTIVPRTQNSWWKPKTVCMYASRISQEMHRSEIQIDVTWAYIE